MGIFDYIGYAFGYVLKFLFDVLGNNYGIAIIFFTLFTKIILFPTAISQQKMQANNARLAVKQKELKERYGNDRQKLQEEQQKLMTKEGINPMGGCLPMLLQMPILFGLIAAINRPLTNVLHLAGDLVTKATATLQTLPGIAGNMTNYQELDVLKFFERIKNLLPGFSETQLEAIGDYSKGFEFLGLNLFDKPALDNILIIIPIICLLATAGSSLLMQKLNGNVQQQGGMGSKAMMFGLAAFSAYISFTVPAAVGFYWILSNIFSLAQSLILHKFYNVNTIGAKTEAQRLALRDQEEERLLRRAGNPAPLFVPLGTVVVNETRDFSKTSNSKNNNTKKKKR